MDRRTLLSTTGLALAGVGLLPAPARAAVRWPLFVWEQPGGFFFPGEGVLAAPRLAVYDDGTGFADAARSLRLPRGLVSELQSHAVRVVRDPAATRRDPDKPSRDRPTDHVRVRDPAGDYLTATLDAWADDDPDDAFPPALHDLSARVHGLANRIRGSGEPWRPSAVLLAAVPLDYTPGQWRPWPSGAPLPGAGRLYAESRLRGDEARAVRRLLPRATERVWPFYKLPDGAFTAATWRHLLPHE